MKVGFVAIVGRPNVGKSSLLNQILDYEVSIISSKPQTTRDQIKGIYNDSDSQIIFIDTPGIHKPKQKLGDILNNSSYASLKDADLVLFLSPLDEEIGPGDKIIIDRIQNHNKVAVMTKLDKSNPDEAKKKANKLKKFGFETVLGTSIEMKKSIEEILKFIKKSLPIGIPFYDSDEITDKSLRFIAKEVIRESIIKRVNQEVPHSIGVVIDEFIEPIDENNNCTIRGTIYVERKSQKGILIGNNGNMIKSIGKEARQKLSNLFEMNVHLYTHVKVNKNWTEKASEISKIGY
ncbi:MAG: GTPase Era [Mycoplasmatales bacterium]|nr:GTPase Era [Mycoplasmatales bacterium]